MHHMLSTFFLSLCFFTICNVHSAWAKAKIEPSVTQIHVSKDGVNYPLEVISGSGVSYIFVYLKNTLDFPIECEFTTFIYGNYFGLTRQHEIITIQPGEFGNVIHEERNGIYSGGGRASCHLLD